MNKDIIYQGRIIISKNELMIQENEYMLQRLKEYYVMIGKRCHIMNDSKIYLQTCIDELEETIESQKKCIKKIRVLGNELWKVGK